MRWPDKFSRFWAYVNDVGGPCWGWRGPKDSKGYGQLWWNGKLRLASRVMIEITQGISLPRNRYACHKCDNPGCVNPSHLFIGTALENNTDSIEKGRARKATGERHSSRTHPESVPFGENSGRCKISDSQVALIRSCGTPSRELGRLLGISKTQVLRIRRFENRTRSTT